MLQEKPLYNLENLHSFGDTDHTLAREIITIFLDQLPGYFSSLSNASASKDWPTVCFTAHKLKSNIRLFNIRAAQEDILQIEADAKNLTNLDRISEKIERVLAILRAVEMQMKNEIQS